MKKFKHLFLIALMLLCVFSLFACSGTVKKSTDNETDTVVEEDSQISEISQVSEEPQIVTRSITYNVTGNGSVTLKDASGNAISNGARLEQGSRFSFVVTPSSGYTVKSVTIPVLSFEREYNSSSAVTSQSFVVGISDVVINVVFEAIPVKYSVTISSTSTYGTVTASKTTDISAGTSITLTVTPSAHCKVDWVKVNGTNQTVSNGKVTFTMPSADVNVTFSFSQIEYTVTLSGTTTYGTVTSDKTKGVYGTQVTLTVTPKEHCKVDYVKVNNVSQTVSNGQVKFTISDNTTVSYAFSQITYNITCNTATNGTLSTSPANKAVEGSTIVVSAEGNSGYTAYEVVITYGSTTERLSATEGRATFIMPSANVIVSATFVSVDNREYVSHMILGDSYTDTWFWRDFYSDFKGVSYPKDIGIGGTQVEHWVALLNGSINFNNNTYNHNITNNYLCSNFVFHIGVNDIDSGKSADTVISSLKNMFSLYHNAYPNANIYWVSLSLNTMFDAQYKSAYLSVNSSIKDYANNTGYLTYIDTCSVMFPDNNANGDWFADGLHFNPDGYATWSAIILDAVGYPRNNFSVFGKAGNYYSSGTFKENADGTVSNSGNALGEQFLWFADKYETNLYAEAFITVNKITNEDQWPKFGMAVKTNGNKVFFYVDTFADYSGHETGVTYRMPEVDDGGGTFLEARDWVWGLGFNTYNLQISYSKGYYTKLALLKSGSDLYFFIDDELVNSITGLSTIDGKGTIGFNVFNLDVTIKEFSVTTNVASKISELGLSEPANMFFDPTDAVTVNANNISNTTKTGEISAWAKGVYSSTFYFETNISLKSVLNNDEYPKAGLVVNRADVGLLMFYIDAISTSATQFGTNLWVGYVYRSWAGSNHDWVWGESKMCFVSGMQYTGNKSAKLGMYKNGGTYVFMVNDMPVLETTRTDVCNEVNVGVMAFNLAFEAKNTKIALSTPVVSGIDDGKSISSEVSYNGNTNEWSSTRLAKSYGVTASDGTRGFKVYAFTGKQAIYVFYEITSSTCTTGVGGWWNNMNVEMYVGSTKIQCFASISKESHNVRNYYISSTRNGDYYKTYVELSIPYCCTEYDGTQNAVYMGFACRPGNESAEGVCEGNANVWWCGPNHATACLTMITTKGIQ